MASLCSRAPFHPGQSGTSPCSPGLARAGSPRPRYSWRSRYAHELAEADRPMPWSRRPLTSSSGVAQEGGARSGSTRAQTPPLQTQKRNQLKLEKLENQLPAREPIMPASNFSKLRSSWESKAHQRSARGKEKSSRGNAVAPPFPRQEFQSDDRMIQSPRSPSAPARIGKHRALVDDPIAGPPLSRSTGSAMLPDQTAIIQVNDVDVNADGSPRSMLVGSPLLWGADAVLPGPLLERDLNSPARDRSSNAKCRSPDKTTGSENYPFINTASPQICATPTPQNFGLSPMQREPRGRAASESPSPNRHLRTTPSYLAAAAAEGSVCVAVRNLDLRNFERCSRESGHDISGSSSSHGFGAQSRTDMPGGRRWSNKQRLYHKMINMRRESKSLRGLNRHLKKLLQDEEVVFSPSASSTCSESGDVVDDSQRQDEVISNILHMMHDWRLLQRSANTLAKGTILLMNRCSALDTPQPNKFEKIRPSTSTRASMPHQPEEEAENSTIQKESPRDTVFNDSRLSGTKAIGEPESEPQQDVVRSPIGADLPQPMSPVEDTKLEVPRKSLFLEEAEPMNDPHEANKAMIMEEGSEMLSPVHDCSAASLDEDAEDYKSSTSSPVATSSGDRAYDQYDEDFDPSQHPAAGEQGMPREDTWLHRFEQDELRRRVMVVVPEGMDENRRVTFVFENTKFDVIIPEGYLVGQEVEFVVPRRPPLERNAAQAACRGHANWDHCPALFEPLRHSSRASGNCTLDDPEFKRRYELYQQLRGRSSRPLLPDMIEDDCESRSASASPIKSPDIRGC